jgi:hypothetical protein
VSPARRAATWLLAVLLTGATGCHGGRAASLLLASERSLIYASVLNDVHPDSATHPVVIDSLLPSTDLDIEQYDKVMSALSIDRGLVDAFQAAQQRSTDRIDARMLTDVRWTVITAHRLDSIRTSARTAASTTDTSRRTRTDLFWQQWYRLYPASGGYVVIAPAGVSIDGTVAIVQVRMMCGPVCGETDLRLLRRNAGGAWRVAGRVRLSES